jgi:hypothetical protein
MPLDIRLPITYNPYKHHFRFLLDEIAQWRMNNAAGMQEHVLTIGNNLIDFYLGPLTVDEVCRECLSFTKQQQIANESEFIAWMNTAEWKKICLPDRSEWLVKRGEQAERYIHIHPAKYSQHTVRVRAGTLKTVVALEAEAIGISSSAQKNLSEVNRVRKEFLNLSPVKSLHPADSGILRLWNIFENGIPDQP